MTGQDADTLARMDAALLAAGRAYFAGRRARVPGFVCRRFGVRGTLRLHRAALGWDMLRAPVNVMLSPIYVLTRLLAFPARWIGLRGLAEWLDRCTILLPTDVARAVEALIVTDLLELPWPRSGQATSRDALAEAVLSAPQVRELIRARRDAADAGAMGRRVAQSVGDYSGTRGAVAEVTTALGTMATGAIAFQALTPGMVSIAPALAALLAQNAAIAAFPLGGTLGAVWYGVFPSGPSAWFAGLTLVVLVITGAVIAALAGIIADPVQVALGIHRRRLLRLIDTLEAQFTGTGTAAFAAREHYLARLMDLADAGIVAARVFRG